MHTEKVNRYLRIYILIILSSCVGPNIGDVRKLSSQNTGSSTLTASVINPPDTYQTTSRIVQVKASASENASNYEFQVLQASAPILTQQIASGLGQLTLPAATFGNFSIRVRFQATTDGRWSDYSSGNTFQILNFGAATVIRALDFTAHTTCGTCALLTFFSCPNYPIPLGCPSNPNDDIVNCYSDSAPGGGNGWICGTDTNEKYLGVNNSNSGVYEVTNLTWKYQHVNSSMNAAIYENGHIGGTDEALVFTCRIQFASECAAGVDSGVSLFFYPYRDPAGSDNVELRYRNCSGSYSNLATARVTQLSGGVGQTFSNKAFLRLDCLDKHITAYYKSGADYVPFIYGIDTVKYNGRNGFGVGPGGVTTLSQRVANFDWRQFP